MSRTFLFGPLKPFADYSWVFRIEKPAIAGPSKTQPAIAGVSVVDFGWYHYSMDFYPLMYLGF